MNRKTLISITLIAIVGIAIGVYLWQQTRKPPLPPPPTLTPTPTPTITPTPTPSPTPTRGQSLVSLESVIVVGDSKVKATWRVHNPSDSTVGLTSLMAIVRGGSVPMNVKLGGVTCTDIGPGQTVLVDQNYDVFKIVEEEGVQRLVPYPKAELDAITDWRSEGGLAEFTSGGCGTGGQTLCAEIEGRTTNSCGDQPRLG